MASKEKSSSRTDLPEEYKMDYNRRGLALIFNQENFSSELPVRKRRGTAIDKATLTKRFQELGFTVKAYDDMKKKKILHKIRKAAKADHANADCFVCVFLSHGEDGHVYAFDDKIGIKETIALFKREQCRSLDGKPKIFIFQACRGILHEEAVTSMGAEESEPEVMEDAAMIYTQPEEADFLLCYSVSDGFVSFRNPLSGSFYIQDLCKTLQQQGSSMEFTELLTLVNLKMSRRCIKDYKQMPCFSSMLTKNLFFRPKEKSTQTQSKMVNIFAMCLSPQTS